MKKYKVFITILIILILLVLTALGLYIFKKDTVKSWLNLKEANGVTQEPKVEEPGKEEAPTKIDKIITREFPDAYRENLIVLDGTTGQNALSQLKEFKDVCDVSGIILTKMDGTAKGGIAVAIQSEYNIPVKYIGVGEQIEDLQKFDSDEFVNALFETKEDISDEE